MAYQPKRRERPEPDPRARPAEARRARLEPLLRRRAARTQLRPQAASEPRRWSSS